MTAAPQLLPIASRLDFEFAEFHAANPHVFRLLRELALQAKRAGKTVGIRCLWERMRWDLAFSTTGADFKLNDRFTSRYARLLNREPDLAGIFETRELRS